MSAKRLMQPAFVSLLCIFLTGACVEDKPDPTPDPQDSGSLDPNPAAPLQVKKVPAPKPESTKALKVNIPGEYAKELPRSVKLGNLDLDPRALKYLPIKALPETKHNFDLQVRPRPDPQRGPGTYAHIAGTRRYIFSRNRLEIVSKSGKRKRIDNRTKHANPWPVPTFSLHGQTEWVLHSYQSNEDPQEDEYSLGTDIYDPAGVLQLQVPGEVDSVSVDGAVATSRYAENSGTGISWRGERGSATVTVDVPSAPIMSTCLSDGQLFVISSGPYPARFRIYDTTTAGRLDLVTEQVLNAACSPILCSEKHGRVAYSCMFLHNGRPAITVFVLADFRNHVLRHFRVPAIGDYVGSLSEDGSLLTVGSSEGAVILVDLRTGGIKAHLGPVDELVTGDYLDFIDAPDDEFMKKAAALFENDPKKYFAVGAFYLRDMVVRLRRKLDDKVVKRVVELVTGSGKVVKSVSFDEPALEYGKRPTVITGKDGMPSLVFGTRIVELR